MVTVSAVTSAHQPANDALWGFDIGLPDGILPLDTELDPEADRSLAVARLDARLARLGATPGPTAHNRLVTRTLSTLAAARRQGAIGAALLLDPVDDAPPREAFLMMFCVEGPDEVDADALDALAESVGRWGRSDIGRRDTAVVHVNGRPAVRYTGFTLLDPDATTSPIVAVRQYWVPVPGTGTCFVLSCWTPQVDAIDAAAGVFDAVAETVVISVAGTG